MPFFPSMQSRFYTYLEKVAYIVSVTNEHVVRFTKKHPIQFDLGDGVDAVQNEKHARLIRHGWIHY